SCRGSRLRTPAVELRGIRRRVYRRGLDLRAGIELRAQPGEIRPAGDALLVCLRAQRAGLVLPGDPHLLAAPGARVGGAGAYQNSGRSYSAISGSRHYDDRGNRDLGLGVDTGLHYLPSIGIAFAPPVPARLSDGARILRSSAVAAVSVLPAED